MLTATNNYGTTGICHLTAEDEIVCGLPIPGYRFYSDRYTRAEWASIFQQYGVLGLPRQYQQRWAQQLRHALPLVPAPVRPLFQRWMTPDAPDGLQTQVQEQFHALAAAMHLNDPRPPTELLTQAHLRRAIGETWAVGLAQLEETIRRCCDPQQHANGCHRLVHETDRRHRYARVLVAAVLSQYGLTQPQVRYALTFPEYLHQLWHQANRHRPAPAPAPSRYHRAPAAVGRQEVGVLVVEEAGQGSRQATPCRQDLGPCRLGIDAVQGAIVDAQRPIDEKGGELCRIEAEARPVVEKALTGLGVDLAEQLSVKGGGPLTGVTGTIHVEKEHLGQELHAGLTTPIRPEDLRQSQPHIAVDGPMAPCPAALSQFRGPRPDRIGPQPLAMQHPLEQPATQLLPFQVRGLAVPVGKGPQGAMTPKHALLHQATSTAQKRQTADTPHRPTAGAGPGARAVRAQRRIAMRARRQAGMQRDTLAHLQQVCQFHGLGHLDGASVAGNAE